MTSKGGLLGSGVNHDIITKLGPSELIKPPFRLIVREVADGLFEGVIHDFHCLSVWGW